MFYRNAKQNLTLSIDAEVLAALRDYADYQGRPMSQCVNLILRKFFHILQKKSKG